MNELQKLLPITVIELKMYSLDKINISNSINTNYPIFVYSNTERLKKVFKLKVLIKYKRLKII